MCVLYVAKPKTVKLSRRCSIDRSATLNQWSIYQNFVLSDLRKLICRKFLVQKAWKPSNRIKHCLAILSGDLTSNNTYFDDFSLIFYPRLDIFTYLVRIIFSRGIFNELSVVLMLPGWHTLRENKNSVESREIIESRINYRVVVDNKSDEINYSSLSWLFRPSFCPRRARAW